MSHTYGCRTRGGTRGDGTKGEQFWWRKQGKSINCHVGLSLPSPAAAWLRSYVRFLRPRRSARGCAGPTRGAPRRSAAAEFDASLSPSLDLRYFKYSVSLLLFINFPSTHHCMPLKITWQTGSRLSLLSWDLIQLNKCTFTFASISHERGEVCG